jgi:hypothetical protein
MSRPTLQELDKLHPDIIQTFRVTGKAAGIPVFIQRYILHLDKAAEIHNHCKNMNRAARELINAFPDDKMSFRTAKYRIEDAINYFHLNSTVKEAAWCNFYADYFEDLAELARADKRLDVAERCMDKAANYRMKAAEQSLNANEIRPHVNVIDPSVPATYFGLPDNIDIKTLWTKREELLDEAKAFVNKLDIRDSQKAATIRDAALNLNITDADYEEDTD